MATPTSSYADTKSMDWQLNHSLTECATHLYMNEHMSDVTFVLTSVDPPKRVPAHRFLLAIRSPVFEAMFYGLLQEVEKEVTLPDAPVDGFLTFLSYWLRNMASTLGILVAMALFATWQHACHAICHFELVNASDPTVARIKDGLIGTNCHKYIYWPPCRIDCVEWLKGDYIFDLDQCGCIGNATEIKPEDIPVRACKNFIIDKEAIEGGLTDKVTLSCSQGISILEQNGQTICFNGQQSCEVPFFDGNDLGRKVNLFFTFRHGDENTRIEDMGDGEQNVLWSAGNPANSSVYIAYNRTGIIVTVRSPEDEVTEVFCEPYQAVTDTGELRSRYLSYPQFNDVRMLYKAGMYAYGTRGSGLLIVTVNNGREGAQQARRCYAKSITAAPELKVSDGPLLIPVSGFYGCLRKVRLERECQDTVAADAGTS